MPDQDLRNKHLIGAVYDAASDTIEFCGVAYVNERLFDSVPETDEAPGPEPSPEDTALQIASLEHEVAALRSALADNQLRHTAMHLALSAAAIHSETRGAVELAPQVLEFLKGQG